VEQPCEGRYTKKQTQIQKHLWGQREEWIRLSYIITNPGGNITGLGKLLA
jgi:hypothetical protein